ncbi:hypothetical protein [Natrialba taiwanensis]|uniref:hypothetical protein n=1 Tax=Natrialba taiwanensis TaxID=160846 RepID=UPI000677F4BC|nr:hypothetical protein [Natrialba taiwanensis]
MRNTALEHTDLNAKTGIMIRESLAPDAANVMLRRTPNGAVSLQWRPESGAETVSTTSGGEDESEVDGGSLEAEWLRLCRRGDTFEAYGSSDGDDWTLLADIDTEQVAIRDEASVVDHNRDNAGARPADRTAIDERLIAQLDAGEGTYIDSQSEVGGYPDLPVRTCPISVPQSGTRAWLRAKARTVE